MKITKENITLLGCLLYNEDHIYEILRHNENEDIDIFLFNRIEELKKEQDNMIKQMKINNTILEAIKSLSLTYLYIIHIEAKNNFDLTKQKEETFNQIKEFTIKQKL